MSHGENHGVDPIAQKLKNSAEVVLLVVFGLLPLFFIPSAFTPFDLTKALFVFAGIIFSLVLYSLSILRSGTFTLRLQPALIAIWVLALVALISALLSGDLKDALVGTVLSIHSAAFMGLIALAATVWVIIDVDRAAILRLYMLLMVSTAILVLFHVLRIFLGPDFLSFGIFTGDVSSLIGGWNDLAIFFGLIVLLSLVAIEQLKLTRNGRIFFSVVSVLGLGMLTIINFAFIWWILALVSLAVLVYTLTKGKAKGIQQSFNLDAMQQPSASAMLLALVVFIVSVLFLIGGSFFGGAISDRTGISYIEVRPSLEATTDIARQVYSENALLGAGTNKFGDAWRLYKNEAINPTIFWNTDFNAGIGYVPTSFVNTGLLGVVSWFAFLGLLVYTGIRMLFISPERDRLWYFIGVSSFVSALYIWIVSFFYVPGSVILLLGALTSGLVLLSANTLSPWKTFTVSIGENKRVGFAMTLVVIVVIVSSVSLLYVSGKHYAAAYTFNHAVGSVRVGTNIGEVEEQIAQAFELSQNDVFARQIAQYQLARINSLLNVQDPSEEQQQQFQNAFVNGINAGVQARDLDPTDPNNWAVLGSIYSILVSINIENSYEEATKALTRARDLDPKNPLRYLALAQLEGRAGNADASRAFVEEAIRLKSNYGDAFFFLSQLDISTGNVEGAVNATRAMVSLEPQNPARYYQLGVLESARGNVEAAAAAFERAVALNPDYANARYFLALAYDALGRSVDARAQLQRVLELNPGNQEVLGLIATIDTQGSLGQQTADQQTQPVNGETAVSEQNGVVTTNEDPGTNLVTPVNNIPLNTTDGEENEADNGNEEVSLPPAETEVGGE